MALRARPLADAVRAVVAATGPHTGGRQRGWYATRVACEIVFPPPSVPRLFSERVPAPTLATAPTRCGVLRRRDLAARMGAPLDTTAVIPAHRSERATRGHAGGRGHRATAQGVQRGVRGLRVSLFFPRAASDDIMHGGT